MNNELNVFKKLTEKEKLSEISNLEKLFPINHPGNSLGPNRFEFSKKDQLNLYIGRIISILDEFGETEHWPKYAGGCCLETIENNYYELILRYIKEFKPEILEYYKEYYGF